jgi:hypothetical protein
MDWRIAPPESVVAENVSFTTKKAWHDVSVSLWIPRLKELEFVIHKTMCCREVKTAITDCYITAIVQEEARCMELKITNRNFGTSKEIDSNVLCTASKALKVWVDSGWWHVIYSFRICVEPPFIRTIERSKS